MSILIQRTVVEKKKREETLSELRSPYRTRPCAKVAHGTTPGANNTRTRGKFVRKKMKSSKDEGINTKEVDKLWPPWYSGTMRALGSEGSPRARVRILSTVRM
ncbi:hypothetical protein E2C01_035403 [Portunus trituberculatus]|uniref:Uncharacterized protein n=1 Tax=Portunus trituberculatus TaxID=210409 RepID=A0A5B7F8D1_PORTR|nr:hypothetical protein [Portunus trituberculatus]